MAGNAPKPWVKLWREERGSFAQLPLYTRALAAELLKVADEDGRIELGSRSPAEAICWLLGATRSDRRLLSRDVALLLDDGYLTHDEEGHALVITAWSEWQSECPKPSRRSHEATTKRPRSDHDRATTEQRPSNETRPKSPKSLARKIQEGEGEGEGDAADAASTRGGGSDERPIGGLVEAVWSREMGKRSHRWTHHTGDAAHLTATGEEARTIAERTGRPIGDVLAGLVCGFLDSRRSQRSWQVRYLAEYARAEALALAERGPSAAPKLAPAAAFPEPAPPRNPDASGRPSAAYVAWQGRLMRWQQSQMEAAS